MPARQNLVTYINVSGARTWDDKAKAIESKLEELQQKQAHELVQLVQVEAGAFLILSKRST